MRSKHIGNTHFSFNSDLSGELDITIPRSTGGRIVMDSISVPAADVIMFVLKSLAEKYSDTIIGQLEGIPVGETPDNQFEDMHNGLEKIRIINEISSEFTRRASAHDTIG